MAWEKVPLPKLIYKAGDETQLSGSVGARLVNAFIDEFGHFRKRPGLTEIADLGSSHVCGLYWWESKQVLIAVMNGEIFKITTPNGNYTNITGDKLLPLNRVSFATDGELLVMANGGKMVTYDNTGVTSYMADADAPITVQNVAYLDGYLLAVDKSVDGRVAFSSPTDITNWSALDVFTAETDPDPIQYLDVRWDEITMFGENLIDVYWNDGATPFIKLQGAVTHKGWIAKDSIVPTEAGWIGLDDRRRISIYQGRQTISVSGPFDNEIREITPVQTADAMLIDFGPQEFYLITFPDTDKTYIYDLKGKSWAEWGSFDEDSGKFKKFIGLTSVYARGWDLTIIGGRTDGKVYKLDKSNYQDGDNDINTLIRTAHITYGTSQRKRSKAVRMRVKRGVGGTTTNPQFTLRWRDDNGAWSNTIAFDLGREGDTDFWISYGPMGIYRARQYEIRHADNSEFIFMDMEEDIEVL